MKQTRVVALEKVNRGRRINQNAESAPTFVWNDHYLFVDRYKTIFVLVGRVFLLFCEGTEIEDIYLLNCCDDKAEYEREKAHKTVLYQCRY